MRFLRRWKYSVRRLKVLMKALSLLSMLMKSSANLLKAHPQHSESFL